MSTTATVGFCRVTIAAPNSRTDMALPEDFPLAELYPEILHLTGLTPDPGAPVGYHLVRRDGTVLDGARTLAGQRVLDGEVLALRPFADSLPPPVHDDVTDAVADAVAGDRRLWQDRMLRLAGLTAAGCLGALVAVVLWFGEPERHEMHGLPGVIAGILAVLLAAFAAVRARVYDDHAAAVTFGLAALPHALVAGTGVLPLDAGHGVGRLELLLGCVAALLVSVVLIAAMPQAAGWFAASACAATFGTLATFGAILTEADPVHTAAVCAPVALGALGFLPALSASLVRLPIGYTAPRPGYDTTDPEQPQTPAPPVDTERIAAQARRGHQLLLGLTGGCAVLATVSVGTLGFSGSGWGRLLALATGVALLTRARLFRYAVQVAVLLSAGLVSLGLLVVGVAADTTSAADGGSPDLRTVWLAAALTAAAAVLATIALVVPRAGLTPFWGRVLDLTEGAVLLSLIPLCLAVLELYGEARGLTSG
ncbi:type VII secretion integral membrane protein EccD [Streptomyces sp. MP131-18]|uniref:type VII secretion integral membrane protein EccD n=1 Tax=Streptomyces sp. MP131-18 TaxID=1857892 RepID=UPI00097C319C|nr:type VII secretion integral membrane protein EccD [Streptomyces sp. MP131-18]ONK10815.1 type VII secretion integral membrane protein EccD [Streptomyces sp. MP131-18]